MKIGATLLFGFVVGTALGAAVLYYNPLTQRGTAGLSNESLVLEYALPGRDAPVVTHGGFSTLPLAPAGVAELWESAIAKIGLSVLTLNGEAQMPRALATRVSVPSASTELLLAGALVSDYWLVTVPGEGSFFVHAEDNLWPYIKDIVLPGRYFGRPMEAARSYTPTVGPEPEAAAAVYGATGRFAGLRGLARSSYRIEAFDASGGLKSSLGRLHLGADILALAPESPDQPGLQ